MKRFLFVLLVGALVGTGSTAHADLKIKTGEQERSYVTYTGDPSTDEDDNCLRDNDSDPGYSLISSCWLGPATITYGFLVPSRSILTGFKVVYYPSFFDSECQVERIWATKVQRRVRVYFKHSSYDGNLRSCEIFEVRIRYRPPS